MKSKPKQPYQNPNLKQVTWKKYLAKKEKPTCRFCGRKNSLSYVCMDCRNWFVEQRKKRLKKKSVYKGT